MRQREARIALEQAIKGKVQEADLESLVKVAATLKVPAIYFDLLSGVLFGKGTGRVLTAEEGKQALDAITVDNPSSDWAASELIGAGDVVSRLGISRGTLDNWRKAHRVVALRKGLRNFVYPIRQFERRKPVDGLERVVPLFETQEDAWEWLVTPNRITGRKPPIEALRAGTVGSVDLVVQAADGRLDFA